MLLKHKLIITVLYFSIDEIPILKTSLQESCRDDLSDSQCLQNSGQPDPHPLLIYVASIVCTQTTIALLCHHFEASAEETLASCHKIAKLSPLFYTHISIY